MHSLNASLALFGRLHHQGDECPGEGVCKFLQPRRKPSFTVQCRHFEIQMLVCLGLNLQVAQKSDEVDILREEVSRDLRSALSNIKLQERGVYVQASTLGSLEALLEFLRTSKIPVSTHFIRFQHELLRTLLSSHRRVLCTRTSFFFLCQYVTLMRLILIMCACICVFCQKSLGIFAVTVRCLFFVKLPFLNRRTSQYNCLDFKCHPLHPRPRSLRRCTYVARFLTKICLLVQNLVYVYRRIFQGLSKRTGIVLYQT